MGIPVNLRENVKPGSPAACSVAFRITYEGKVRKSAFENLLFKAT